jgi:adenylosuccinate synthase
VSWLHFFTLFLLIGTGVIGNGVVVHLPTLLGEIDELIGGGVGTLEERLKLSDRAHVVFDFHQVVDGLYETARGKAGTYRRGSAAHR